MATQEQRSIPRHARSAASAASLTLFLLITLAPVPGHAQTIPSFVLRDPPAGLRPTASMEEIAITSGGVRMNGLVYRAAGPGPHPLAVFLHGYPGNERNLDLAQAVRRAGYQAVFFDYRGTWGSGGTFSLGGALEDVGAVLAWVRAPENATAFDFDPDRIALVGHSLGGWLALMKGAQEPPGVCVAAIAAWNIGWAARRFPDQPKEKAQTRDYYRVTTDPASGPVHANADVLLQETLDRPARWDYLSQAAAFRDRALLLVASTRDAPAAGIEMQSRLASAVRLAGGRRVRSVTYDDDHVFSSHRIALMAELTRWLGGDCAKTQRRAPRPTKR